MLIDMSLAFVAWVFHVVLSQDRAIVTNIDDSLCKGRPLM